ncbi:MAG: 3-methyl-2-oxobutanoate hydroxymethyltransferase [Planctomycetota bacterium]
MTSLSSSPTSGSSDDRALDRPVTLRALNRRVNQGERFACLTAYDATMARWLQQAGVPVLLVGDSLAEVVLGLPSTIHAPLEIMLALTAGVKRGAPRCFVMGDMPFMSYQADEADAMRNAGRFLTEGLADSVKVEVTRDHIDIVRKMASAGIPVIAHFGTRPQHVKTQGYRVSGKTASEAAQIVDEAIAFEDAGASMLLIEAVPAEVAERVVERTSIPVIGCGAGPACHGQIVVTQDLLGLTPRQPSFAQPIDWHGEPLIATIRTWIDRVQTGNMGDHPYHMPDDEARKF